MSANEADVRHGSMPDLEPVHVAGHTFVHKNEVRQSNGDRTLETCRTRYPATTCTCGTVRLQWLGDEPTPEIHNACVT